MTLLTMSATIQFKNGSQATYRDGRWQADDSQLEALLDAVGRQFAVHQYLPDPEADHAERVAAELGGRLVSSDPVDNTEPGVDENGDPLVF